METSKLIQGLMRLKNVSVEELKELIEYDFNHDIKTFDLSDIYNDGESERKFGEALKLSSIKREDIFIQTKCGLVKRRSEDVYYYDLSKDHIIESVKASLKRLNLSYIDSLLLHRCDILMNKEEVIEAIKYLKNKGLIKEFGVSNFSKEAIEYLNDDNLIKFNQLQLGLGHLNMIKNILNFNTSFNEGIDSTNDIFFYLKRKNIEIQCWSPFQVNMFEGVIFDNPNFKEGNEYLNLLANKYEVDRSAIALAFLFKLGNNIKVILGSVNIKHIKDALPSRDLNLTNEEWYTLYRKFNYKLP